MKRSVFGTFPSLRPVSVQDEHTGDLGPLVGLRGGWNYKSKWVRVGPQRGQKSSLRACVPKRPHCS